MKRIDKRVVFGLLVLMIIMVLPISVSAAEPALVSAVKTDECYACHISMGKFPAIMADWKNSKHAGNGVTCKTCHAAELDDPDALAHYGFTMSPVVSPKDCGQCHTTEVEENNRSLHALGAMYYSSDYDNKKLPYLESEITLEGSTTASHTAAVNGCQQCHGTNMKGKNTKDPSVWPNNGIGRINPDGSLGSCAACHTRHLFSVEEARKPEACGQCHLGPDHPQKEMYEESKHGAIYATEGDTWNWGKEDWEAGVDYRAPTCAVCHMTAAGGVTVTHDVSSRLSWELEPAVSRHTDNTANGLGTPISDGSTWQVKRARMQSVCKDCHSTTWVENYYTNGDAAVELYNKKYADGLAIVDGLKADGLLTAQGFDEPIEFKIYEMWHHEGRRARMGAFMMAPDYVQWHGFYELLRDKAELVEMAGRIRADATKSETPSTPGFAGVVGALGILGAMFVLARPKK